MTLRLVACLCGDWHPLDRTPQMEAETSLYATEVREWRAEHPRPNLGDFMVSCSSSWSSGRMAA